MWLGIPILPTAKSYALIEERWGLLRRRSYLLSESVDARTAYHLMADTKIAEQEKKRWAKKIYDLFSLLKRGQISHGDLKAQNIMCPVSGPSFIDLDGMETKQSYEIFYRQFKKDIMRFQRSWSDEVLIESLFKEYCVSLLK